VSGAGVAELHFYPHEGDGYAAIQSLVTAPSILAYEQAEVNVSKQKLQSLQCKGTDVNKYICQFEYLVKKAQLIDDKDLIRYFCEGFEKDSPYYDKLHRLLEEDKSLQEIMNALLKYYGSNVCLRKDTKDKVNEAKEGGKRKKGNGDAESLESNNGSKRPRLQKDDFAKLTPAERKSYLDTGKIAGYVIEADPGNKGVVHCRKSIKEGEKLTNCCITSDNESEPEDDDSTARALYKMYGF
jgi:hypothetical protein